MLRNFCEYKTFNADARCIRNILESKLNGGHNILA